jgi:hypothetical protein
MQHRQVLIFLHQQANAPELNFLGERAIKLSFQGFLTIRVGLQRQEEFVFEVVGFVDPIITAVHRFLETDDLVGDDVLLR